MNIQENELLFAKLREDSDAKIPEKRFEDGWYDLYASFDGEYTKILPGQVKLIPTGIMSAFSPTKRITFGERGSSVKTHLVVMAGKIDSGYRGEWFVALLNPYTKPVVITKDMTYFGEKEVAVEDDYNVYVSYKKAICQFDVTEVPQMNVIQVSKGTILGYTSERMDGCLGSSGK